MVGNSFGQGMIQFQASISDVFLDKYGMVDHLAVETELRVFNFDCVVTVRAGGQDPFYIITLESFNIGLGEDLV